MGRHFVTLTHPFSVFMSEYLYAREVLVDGQSFFVCPIVILGIKLPEETLGCLVYCKGRVACFSRNESGFTEGDLFVVVDHLFFLAIFSA